MVRIDGAPINLSGEFDDEATGRRSRTLPGDPADKNIRIRTFRAGSSDAETIRRMPLLGESGGDDVVSGVGADPSVNTDPATPPKGTDWAGRLKSAGKYAEGGFEVAGAVSDYMNASAQERISLATADYNEAMLDIERESAVEAYQDRLGIMQEQAAVRKSAADAAIARSGIKGSSATARQLRRAARRITDEDILAYQNNFTARLMGYQVNRSRIELQRMAARANAKLARLGALVRVGKGISQMAIAAGGGAG